MLAGTLGRIYLVFFQISRRYYVLGPWVSFSFFKVIVILASFSSPLLTIVVLLSFTKLKGPMTMLGISGWCPLIKDHVQSILVSLHIITHLELKTWSIFKCPLFCPSQMGNRRNLDEILHSVLIWWHWKCGYSFKVGRAKVGMPIVFERLNKCTACANTDQD